MRAELEQKRKKTEYEQLKKDLADITYREVNRATEFD
jgi:hypothetical protein